MPSLVDFVLVEVNGTYSLLAFTDTAGYLWTTLGEQNGADITWSDPVNSNFKASNLASGARINTNLVVISSNKGIISIKPFPAPEVFQPATATTASTNTQLCPLDLNMFAASYPNNNNQLVTLVGSVIEGSSTIAWSNNSITYPYAEAHSLACFAPFHYVLSSVQEAEIISEVVFYSYMNGTVASTLSAKLEGVTALNFIRSVPLKRTLAVGGILYIDALNNNALSVAAFSLSIDQLEFGSIMMINNGGTIVQEPSSMMADINTLGVENGFVVSYSDWSNEEKITILIGEVTESNALAAASPAYVLSPSNEDVLGQVYWNSVVAISDTTFVTVYSLMNSTSSISTASSVGHVFNSPIGVVLEQTKVDGAPGVVIGVSGQCKVPSTEMVAGYYYYSDGVGSLFMPDPSQTTLDEYLDLGTMLLSKNSLVGIGISDEDLLIKSSAF